MRGLALKSNLVSNPLTMAPMARAEPAAAKPATPPPMIRTYTWHHTNTRNHERVFKTGLEIFVTQYTLSTHLCRWHFASCCDLSSEKTPEAVCCQHDCLVPEMRKTESKDKKKKMEIIEKW